MENLKVFKKLFLKFFIFSILYFGLFCSYSYSKDIDLGVHLRNGNLKDFYFLISDYYKVPLRDVYIIRKHNPFIMDEELPILFFIVKEARVKPDVVIKYRKSRYSWYDIMVRFGLYPQRVFEQYIVVEGPPYGNAWGYYKKHPKKVIIFRDVDIIELSNIKFISAYYHEKPEIVIETKKKYSRYVDLHREFYFKNKRKKHKF